MDIEVAAVASMRSNAAGRAVAHVDLCAFVRMSIGCTARSGIAWSKLFTLKNLRRIVKCSLKTLQLLSSHGIRCPFSTLFSTYSEQWKSLSCVRLFVTPCTIACQAPLSMGFSRQEYWSGLTFPPPGDLPDPGIEPRSPALAGSFFTDQSLEIFANLKERESHYF